MDAAPRPGLLPGLRGGRRASNASTCVRRCPPACARSARASRAASASGSATAASAAPCGSASASLGAGAAAFLPPLPPCRGARRSAAKATQWLMHACPAETTQGAQSGCPPRPARRPTWQDAPRRAATGGIPACTSRPGPLCAPSTRAPARGSGTRAPPAPAHLTRGGLPGGLALGRGALVGLTLAPVGLLLQPLLLLREGREGWLSGVGEVDASMCRAQHLGRL